jgi:hypothetical protein
MLGDGPPPTRAETGVQEPIRGADGHIHDGHIQWFRVITDPWGQRRGPPVPTFQEADDGGPWIYPGRE